MIGAPKAVATSFTDNSLAMFVPSAARRAKKPGGACDDNRLSTEVNRYSQRLDRRLRGPAGGLAFARRIFLPWLQILPPWALTMRSMWRSAPCM